MERAAGFVVLPGSIGTLTELFLSWTLVSAQGRAHAPIVLLGDHWAEFLAALHDPDMVLPSLFAFVERAESPADAARRSLSGVPPAHAGAADPARPESPA